MTLLIQRNYNESNKIDSQDGHGALLLPTVSARAFVRLKVLNIIITLAVGTVGMIFLLFFG